MRFIEKIGSNFKVAPITNVRFAAEYIVTFLLLIVAMAMSMYFISEYAPSTTVASVCVVVMFIVYMVALSRPFVRRWYAITGNSDLFTIYIVSFFAVIPPVSFILAIPLLFPWKDRTNARIEESKKVL